MIKLESKSSLPSAVSVLEIRSAGELPSVQLSTEEAREQDAKGEWSPSKFKVKQRVTFIGADGNACSIEATVPESEAVEIPAAFKIVAQVTVSNELKAAYQAGRVSKAYTSLELVRVVEVWDTAKNCAWKAPTFHGNGVAREVDLTGNKAKV